MCAGKEKPFYVMLQDVLRRQLSAQSIRVLFTDRSVRASFGDRATGVCSPALGKGEWLTEVM